MKERVWLGIDIAKLSFVVCLLMASGKTLKAEFSNNLAGFRKLLSWLHGYEIKDIHVCLEPTGVYSKAIAIFLFQSGFMISQVNSYTVQCYGRGKNIRSKTDRIDAFLLADYCRTQNPPTWEPPSNVQSQLAELQHRLTSVDEQIRQEENRLEVAEFKVVREDIEDSLGRLYVRKKRLEADLKALVKSDEALRVNYEIVNSIIGLGEKSTLRLLALVQFHRFEHPRQTGCFAGLAPREFDSGTSVHKRSRISRVGSSELRSALYFPAMVAIQHNPQFRDFAERLKQRNKPSKVIICAVMRKLLVLACTLVQKQQFYDPEYKSPLAIAT